MYCVVRVQESEDYSRILLPFEVDDGAIVAVRDVNNGVRRLNLLCPEKWDALKSGMSGNELRHLDYGHDVANLDHKSRELKIRGHCLRIDADSLAYLGTDFVKVTAYDRGADKVIAIEPFAASKKRREAERSVA
ncbi:MAG: hypothetical protein HY517_00770 [Candidatus Aenigmarchaeota archaeon]|nr:hypothetical protein [Candidatus Aenigmarchaeota archaeon]